MTTYLSGLQPSGRQHLGNGFGAIRQHLDFSDSWGADAEHFCFIADDHALITSRDAEALRARRRPHGEGPGRRWGEDEQELRQRDLDLRDRQGAQEGRGPDRDRQPAARGPQGPLELVPMHLADRGELARLLAAGAEKVLARATVDRGYLACGIR